MISVITVVYNAKETIEKTIKTVINQTYNDYEYIIIDGKSDDGTWEIIESYGDYISYKVSEKDKGVYDAMNKGLSIAKGSHICFLNSGDLFFDNDLLSHVGRIIQNNPSHDIFYGNAIITFPEGGECWQVCGDIPYQLMKRREEYLSNASIGKDLIHQSIFASRKCFENNEFNTEYRLRAEMDWYYACIEKGFRFYRMDLNVCRYIFGGLSEESTSIKKSIDETKEILSRRGYSINRFVNSFENAYITSQVFKITYSKWIEAIHEGKSIARYLRNKRYTNVAIYGYGELGNQLCLELKNTDVNVICFIDRDCKYEYQNIPCFKLENITSKEEIEAIIISAVHYKKEIREVCEEHGFSVVFSLDEILDELLMEPLNNSL